MPTELETLSDVISLMELCAQLEEEQSRIVTTLPTLKRAIESDAKEKHEAALRRSAEIAGQLSALEKKVSEEMKEVRGHFSRVAEAIEARKREHEDYQKKAAVTVPEPLKRHVADLFAEMPKPKDSQPGRDASILSRFRGNFSKDTVYRAEDVFTFRGSTYLVLRDVRGLLPTAEAQKGPKAAYAVIAAAGAPGINPPPPDSGGSVAFVTAPATATSPGVHPSIAVTNFHVYFTIAANTWRRTAIGSW
jgi:hypothetical protein